MDFCGVQQQGQNFFIFRETRKYGFVNLKNKDREVPNNHEDD